MCAQPAPLTFAGVGVVVFKPPSLPGDAPEVLLIRRGKEPSKGLWCFPGGSQELGEAPRPLPLPAGRALVVLTAQFCGVHCSLPTTLVLCYCPPIAPPAAPPCCSPCCHPMQAVQCLLVPQPTPLAVCVLVVVSFQPYWQGETIAECAAREVLEETGLVVQVEPDVVCEGFSQDLVQPTAFAAVDSLVRGPSGDIRFHYAIIEVAALVARRSHHTPPRALDDADAAMWFPAQQLRQLPGDHSSPCHKSQARILGRARGQGAGQAAVLVRYYPARAKLARQQGWMHGWHGQYAEAWTQAMTRFTLLLVAIS
ncbi:ADP-ribose pyrophosphatase [Haematococcus lacustris]|uniref:ADP-ribose pyrophosphatase n=1 Tax=Haematococcus lacustris TaxID=44745 RepID=A0A6A0A5F1_HAELA|nr:ADP-ribose pyrophosphatase [Haematococcus lacustris]